MRDKIMFSESVVETDDFCYLPHEAQLLYFHLCFNADSDGFVNNARTTAKVNEIDEKWLNLLTMRDYLIKFEDGVYLIKHWYVSNSQIPKNKYQKSIYTDHLNQVELDNDVYQLKE